MKYTKHRDGNTAWPWSVHITSPDGRCATVYFQSEAAADDYIRQHTTTNEYTNVPKVAHYTCGTSRNVRGNCGHKHRTVAAAERCNARDQHGCASQGGYSDRRIIVVESDGSCRPLDCND